MNHQTHYDTVSTAIEELRRQGFTADFNIQENKLVCNTGKYDTQNFEVVDIYRYEGNTDPADEAAVYAIQSSDGTKGILVTGYGASSDNDSGEILKKLNKAHRD